MKRKLIEMENIHFAYTNKEILCSLNFDVYEQDFIALIGDNAAKSTMMNLMLGFLKPNIGTVKTDIFQAGYVPQGGLLNVKDFPASVFEVVAMRLPDVSIFNLHKDEIISKVEHALERVGIVDLMHERISDLSGGQLQRALIAREIVCNPDILFLDEPTNGLDTNSIKNLFDLLKEFNEKDGLTIVVVSHQLDDVITSVNRIVRVKGRNIEEVAVDDISI